MATALFLIVAAACQALGQDVEQATPAAPAVASKMISRDDPAIVCAFFGLDNALPFGANVLAPGAFRKDGMPVSFRDEIEGRSLDADDFVVIDSLGTRHTPIGAVLRPANEVGENRTVLLIGEFGNDGTNPPVEVQIVGDLLTRNKHPDASAPSDAKNLKGASTKNIIPLGNGPKMFFAQILTGKLVEELSDGGQVIQVAWEGGIRPIDKRVKEKDLFKFYVVHVNKNGKLIPVTPTSIADIGDNDNFHQLRIDSDYPVAKVSIPAGTVKDPNGDPNPDTEIAVTYAPTNANTVSEADRPLAFPTAEGWGRFAIGGRGGDVYAVTNLNDNGPGSLRNALSASHRTVVFRVSGTIELKSLLLLDKSHITIAGQTAPGDGICLRGCPLLIRRTNNIIVRYLRIRVGDEFGKPVDGLEVRDSENVIIDHCSVSWSSDEAINTWHGTKKLTVQWCLISEPLHRSVNYGPHGYGASLGGENTSYHHNLFAHCAGRNPSIAGGDHDHTTHMDYRNNVIYNWLHRSCDGKPKSINVVNNYYKPGPATRPHVRRRIARIDDNMAKYGNFEPRWYIEGNVVEGEPKLTGDNWSGGVDFQGNTNEAKNRQRTPFPFAPVKTQTAADAYKLVLADVGANRPARDTVDTRVLKEVSDGTASRGEKGIIDRQDEAGGWPLLRNAPAPVDTDGDGMPDAWEKQHGLDSSSAADGNGYWVDDDYTNLESYLNETASGQAVRGRR